MAAVSREQFVEQVMAHVRAKFPLVKLARARQPFSLLVNGNIASLENLYRMAALQPQEMHRQVERWMVEMLRASEGTPDSTASFDQLRERILPMVLASNVTDVASGTMVAQPFIDKLFIAYAVDNDRTIAYIPRHHFDTWKIPLEQLHETALANLVGRSEELAAHAAADEAGRVNLIVFQTMDGYDASRILLPDLHQRLSTELGSPFAAAIPNRDILICFRNDDEMVENLRNQIAEDYRQMPHQITARILLVTADGIAMR